MLGNGRLEALCFDGEKRLAHIRGKLRKKVWINQGDIILLSLRDYQDEKGDVILKYSADEARSLKAYGELPESAKINETDTYVILLTHLLPLARLLDFLARLHYLGVSHLGWQQWSLDFCFHLSLDSLEHGFFFSKLTFFSAFYSYGHEGIDDNVEFDEDRDGSDDDKDIDVDEI